MKSCTIAMIIPEMVFNLIKTFNNSENGFFILLKMINNV